MPPLGIQLYTLRAQLEENFEPVVRHVAEIGYAGVETAGVYGDSPESAAQLFAELGLEVFSMHAKTPIRDNLTMAIDTAGVLQTKRVICPWYPPESFATVDAIKATCAELNTISEILQGNGLQLLYHNHWAECGRVDGKFIYEYMYEFLEPAVGFEFDVYWSQTAGADPAAALRTLGKRASLLHIKDGPTTMDGDMTAVGEGKVNFDAIAEASKGNADWWVVELDRCATDMMEAVEKSFKFITSRGYAHGRK